MIHSMSPNHNIKIIDVFFLLVGRFRSPQRELSVTSLKRKCHHVYKKKKKKKKLSLAALKVFNTTFCATSVENFVKMTFPFQLLDGAALPRLTCYFCIPDCSPLQQCSAAWITLRLSYAEVPQTDSCSGVLVTELFQGHACNYHISLSYVPNTQSISWVWNSTFLLRFANAGIVPALTWDTSFLLPGGANTDTWWPNARLKLLRFSFESDACMCRSAAEYTELLLTQKMKRQFHINSNNFRTQCNMFRKCEYFVSHPCFDI